MTEQSQQESGPDLKRTRRVRQSNQANVDRLPPYDLKAEQAVLGCAIDSPNEILGMCVEKFGSSSKEVFYDLRHQTIYETMIQMYDEREAIDIVTLQSRLSAFAMLEQIGGLAYLMTLLNDVTTIVNAPYYIDIVSEKFLLRKMIATCTDIVGRVYDYEGEVPQLMDEVERDILKIAESRVQNGVIPVRDLVVTAINEIESDTKQGGTPSGLLTGFADLDAMTGGLRPKNMIVIAARPSMGKTSFAMNVAENVAIESKLPVGVFSLEMSNTELIKRMILSRSRVSIRNVRDGFLADRDYPRITGAAGSIANAPIYIDDSPALSILQVRAKARRMAQQYGIKLFVIDYLQLMNAIGGKRRFENRQQEVSDISAGVKALAKELAVPVIVLSQLNRAIEQDKNRKPRLSDIRESGSIEQDADLIGFLYKPKTNETDNDDSVLDNDRAIPVNLFVAKQRNGPTGDVYLMFLRQFTRFESAARVSEEDVPYDAPRESQTQFPD